MHPAPSVIIFTALSGLGFGLMAWLGFNPSDITGMTVFIFYVLAYGLAVGGLLASTFHLGNPQRAMNAFSQWRTSWLSREGVVSVLTLLVTAIYAASWIFLDNRITWLGALSAFLSLATVYCTSMIYAQMKTVPRWRSGFTPVLFLLYAIGGGALLAGQAQIAAVLIAALTLLQFIDWQIGDKRFARSGSTMASATGLGNLGEIRLLESPHSGSNYLMHEMVYVIGRKHGQKLRMIAMICLGIVPAVVLFALPVGHMLALVLVLLHLTGLFISRWLFFAQAEHVVGLYYGKR